MERLKNSVGIWAFGANATRFMPGGYHPKEGKETTEQRLKRAIDGLGDLVDGFEMHYPGEINEENVEKIKTILGKDKDIYAVALGLFCYPEYALGSFIHPDKKIRKKTIEVSKKAIDLAKYLKSHFIIWPGGEGYNYPIQANYEDSWNFFIDGVAEVVDYAYKNGVTVFLEHKNSEPAMKILMRDLGMSMYMVFKIKEKGVNVSKLKLNMDWQHLLMNGEHLAEYACILAREGLLGHQHANSGWGSFDDDNMVGASLFIETLALAIELQRLGYGKNGERIGYDLFPYTEDQVEAVKQSILIWEFIYNLANKVDKKALREAQTQKDAVKCYQIVYKTLGLNDAFIKSVYASRKKSKK